jgi:hypothetical protein
MQGPPIPRRIPPLAWRKPAFIWTPLALAFAIGWPFLAFRESTGLANTMLITGAFVYAAALTTLGVAWAFGRAPRSRREVVLHVVIAGMAAALAAPYVLTRLLSVAAEGDSAFTLPMALSVTPLAIVLGLPIALLSGLAFALVALERPGARGDAPRIEVQPFR